MNAYIGAVFWLVFSTDRGPCVIIQPAASLISAHMSVAVRDLAPGEFTEGHQLDANMIRKIPKTLVGSRSGNV